MKASNEQMSLCLDTRAAGDTKTVASTVFRPARSHCASPFGFLKVKHKNHEYNKRSNKEGNVEFKLQYEEISVLEVRVSLTYGLLLFSH